MRIACIGSRSLDARHYSFVMGIVENFPIGTIVVSGGAVGTNTLFESAAKMCGLKVEIYFPDYDVFGGKAPLIRNEHIIKNCDRVIAIWDLKSTGTIHALKIAKSLKKPITIHVI